MSIELAFAVIQVRHLVQQSILQGLHALNTLVQNSIQHIEVLNTSMIQHIMVNVPKMKMNNIIRQFASGSDQTIEISHHLLRDDNFYPASLAE